MMATICDLGPAIVEIFTWLKPNDLISASGVCGEWRQTIRTTPFLWFKFAIPQKWLHKSTLLAHYVPYARDLKLTTKLLYQIFKLSIVLTNAEKVQVSEMISKKQEEEQTHSRRRIAFTETKNEEEEGKEKEKVKPECLKLFLRDRSPHLRKLSVCAIQDPLFVIGTEETEEMIKSLCEIQNPSIELVLVSDVSLKTDYTKIGNVVNEAERIVLFSMNCGWAAHKAMKMMEAHQFYFSSKQRLGLKFAISRWVDKNEMETKHLFQQFPKQKQHTVTEIAKALDSNQCPNCLSTKTKLQTCLWWCVCYHCGLFGHFGLCWKCAEKCHKEHNPLYQYFANSPFCDCDCLHDSVNWSLLSL